MFELFPLTVGLLGSLHCLGMCGPLALAFAVHTDRGGADRSKSTGFFSRQRGMLRHMAFHLGRLFTYGLLGAVAASIFRVAELSRMFFQIREGATLIAGVILMLLGLILFQALPLPAFLMRALGAPTSLLNRMIHPMARSGSLISGLALGMAAGYLPCCLSWAMIVTAASTGSPLEGFFTMISFGLGTVPVLLATGLCGAFLSHRIRFLGERAAALSITGMGVALVFRGVGILA